MKSTPPRKPLSTDAEQRSTMVFEGCQFHSFPLQKDTIYLTILNVLFLKKILLLMWILRRTVRALFTLMLQFAMLAVAKFFVNVEGNRTDYKLHLHKSDFSNQHESIMIMTVKNIRKPLCYIFFYWFNFTYSFL